MRRLSGLLAAALLLAGSAQTAAPALAGGPLENARRFKLFLTDLSEASQACGLTPSAMSTAFMRSVRDGGIEIVESSAYWLNVRATTIRYSPKVCITNLDARAQVNTRYFNPATIDEKEGRVELWARSLLLVSDVEEHGVQVNSALRGLGQSFLERWRRDQ